MLPGVRTRIGPRTSSTPRPDERQVSASPLLASAPGGVPAINHDGSPLQVRRRGPLPPSDEASTLACRVRARRPDAPGVRPPLKTIARVYERGLTAQPSPI